MKIPSAIQTIHKFQERAILRAANNTRIEKFVKNMRSNSELFQRILLGTILTRYIWKTAVYITTNNLTKDLPEDQKHFSNAMSMTNCILQLSLVAAIGETIRKKSGKWAEHIFKNLSFDPVKEELAHLGFRSFLTIAVAGAFVQKFIVTMISTPTGSWLRHKYLMDPTQAGTPASKQTQMKVETPKNFVTSL